MKTAKQAFDGMDVLVPLDGAPRRHEFRTKEEHLAATYRFIDQWAAQQPPSAPITYKCARCKDEGWTYRRDEKRQTWAARCDHSQRGDWAQDNFGFPDHVQRVQLFQCRLSGLDAAAVAIIKRRRTCLVLALGPNMATRAGLALAIKLSESGVTVRCVSAKDAPNDYATAWTPPCTQSDVAMVRDIDRRLSPAQVQHVVNLIDGARQKYLVIMCEPLKNWPKTNAWAALALALQARDATTIDQ